jgi:hypothetical protein
MALLEAICPKVGPTTKQENLRGIGRGGIAIDLCGKFLGASLPTGTLGECCSSQGSSFGEQYLPEKFQFLRLELPPQLPRA